MAGVFSIADSADGVRTLDEQDYLATWSGNSNGSLRLPFIGDDRNELLPAVTERLLEGHFELSPIVFCGPTATGKTFLAQTILQSLANRFGWNSSETLFLSASDFTRQVAQALETNSLNHFRSRFDTIQALVLDACQDLTLKPQAQRELISLIDSFHESSRVVIVTSNTLPTRIEGLDPSLGSRLSEGINLQLHPPGPIARRAILKLLLDSHTIRADDEALNWLVQELNGPVPELVRFVNRLGFEQRHPSESEWPFLNDDFSDTDEVATLDHQRNGAASSTEPPLKMVDLSDIRRALASAGNQRPATKVIAQRVAREFRLKLKDLTSQSRKQSIVRARGIAMFLSRRINKESLEKIGDFFGGRDHTTVLHSCRKIAKELRQDAATERMIREIASEYQVPWSEIESDDSDPEAATQ